MEAWVAELQQGRFDAAWDLFLDRYRRLIFAAIRHCAQDYDDVMDVFARVCEAFRENDFNRLGRCAARVEPDRPITTWIVAVVRNITIDWFRHRDGRKRLSAFAQALPAPRKQIFEYVFVQQRSHVETYELLRSRDGFTLMFGEFLEELKETYRAATAGRRGRLTEALALPPPDVAPGPLDADPAEREEQHRELAAALETLPPDDRLALQLYVVDGMPAGDVARALGYANAKTVYNRVYRALAMVRTKLEQVGIERGAL
ncbi:MAG TPA: sigma-70 family RNA polymerase sigma factor [Gemmatimonadales bacterium]|nr:sigma-70 family RNA polymerase sigma factor [Gemmatimonadales bacterium]